MLPLQLGVLAPVTPVQPPGLTVGAPDSVDNIMTTPPSRTPAGMSSSWGVGFNVASQMWEATALLGAAQGVPETCTPQQKGDKPAAHSGERSRAPGPAPTYTDEPFLSPLLKAPERTASMQVRLQGDVMYVVSGIGLPGVSVRCSALASCKSCVLNLRTSRRAHTC